MLTCGASFGSKLSGWVNKTYYEHCGVPLKIYSIDTRDNSFSKDESIKILENSLKNREKYFYENIDSRYVVNEDENYYYINDVNELYHNSFLKDDFNSVDEAKIKINNKIRNLIKKDKQELVNSLNFEYLIEFSKEDIFDDNDEDELIQCPKCQCDVLKNKMDDKCPKCCGKSYPINVIMAD